MATSMTGFGSAQGQNKHVHLSIQIKTVNGRFFDPKFRLPKLYQSFESELRQHLSESFFRGTIDVFINRSEVDGAGEKQVVVDTQLAKGWLKACTKLSKDLKIKFTPTVEGFIRIPDIFQIEEPSDVDSSEKEMVVKTFTAAMKDCLTERKREGEKLLQNLNDLTGRLRSFASRVEDQKELIDSSLKTTLEKKVKTLVGDYALDPQRLNQEVIFILERSDISEEIVRLKAHLEGVAKTLSEKGSIGKKLDFLVQELHREVNTIGSKTQTLEIMNSVIQAKADIEKIREQVQNIE